MSAIESIASVLGAAAVVPPLLYLLTLTFFDKRPEPAYAVVGTFLLAVLSTAALQLVPHAPTALTDALLDVVVPAKAAFAWFDPGRPLATLTQAVIDIAVPEETAKLLVLMIFARRFLAYDHPMEGVVYGAAVGLGLAAYENLLLAVHLPEAWREHGVIRSMLTVPMHGALGVIAGVYVARAKFGNTLGAGHGTAHQLRSYFLAWLVPISCHALYNFPLLLVRNTIGLHPPYASVLQTAGFAIGTLVVLGAARLVYRVTLAQGPSRGRYGPGSLFGYRAWRLDILGMFVSFAGALMILIEAKAAVQGEAFALDRHIVVLVGAASISAAVALHHRAIRTEMAFRSGDLKTIA